MKDQRNNNCTGESISEDIILFFIYLHSGMKYEKQKQNNNTEDQTCCISDLANVIFIAGGNISVYFCNNVWKRNQTVKQTEKGEVIL